MHLRAYKIYKKRKRKIKIVLDDVERRLFSIKFFIHISWFVQPNFWVGYIWVQFHPSLGFPSLRWIQNICGKVCFKHFYWHSNVNNLLCATKNQKKRGLQAREERRGKNGEEEKTGLKYKKKRLNRRWGFLAYWQVQNKPMLMGHVSHWLYQP